MRQQITSIIRSVLKELGVSDVTPEVEISEKPSHGEYTTNIAMKLAKVLKKAPMEIALQVKEAISHQLSAVRQEGHDQKITQKDQTLSPKSPQLSILQAIDHIEAVPPGFLNVFLSEVTFSTHISQVLKHKGPLTGLQPSARLPAGQVVSHQLSDMSESGKLKTESSRRSRVMVEYTDPNPFKEFHIGHLYSNSVGESLARLLAALGHEVKRSDYYGDVGMHVAKSLWGILQNFQFSIFNFQLKDVKNILSELGKKTLKERLAFFGRCYAAGTKAFKEAGEAAEEIKKLNKYIYVAAQELGRETGEEIYIDYRQGEAIDEELLAAVKELFQVGRAWSMEYFETIFRRLGTKFDFYHAESVVGEYGAKFVREHIGDVFEESEGAIVYRGEANGLHTRVFINALGFPTYEAKEIGLCFKKYQDYRYDLSLIITGNEINEYFRVLMAAIAKVHPELARKNRHIGHGMVRNADGSKMSSRTGDVLTGEGLLDEAKASIYEILEESESKANNKVMVLHLPGERSSHLEGVKEDKASQYSQQEKDDIAEKAAIAAVKYSLLRVRLPADVAFDIKKSVSFEGESGPYLQYTYARCKSVLRKAGSRLSLLSNLNGLRMNPEERAVARLLFYFPEIVAEAAGELAPNTLCTYLFSLAQAFNLFYQKHSILGGDKREATSKKQEGEKGLSLITFRLSLTAATAQVIKNGLYLLGIETVERM